MKLSIITINLNNAGGLQITLESVIKQSFTDYEYIVIDGDSLDGSREIIEANIAKFSYWVSEKDVGVYHAMNKGIKKATGAYLLFLNSGDYLMNEKILEEVSIELDGTGIIYGNILLIESVTKSWTGVYPDKLSFHHFIEGSLPNPASFIKRSVFEIVGYYDESLKIVADWKFFLDAICWFNVSYKHIDKTMAVFYLDGLSSTGESAAIIQRERTAILQRDYPLFMETYHELAVLKDFIKDIFGIKRYAYNVYNPASYETHGNYIYSTSEREFEKAAMGLDLPVVAFKGTNDYYEEGVEFQTAGEESRHFKKIKNIIATMDNECEKNGNPYNLLVSIIFKTMPKESVMEVLRNTGFRVNQLPRNPYV